MPFQSQIDFPSSGEDSVLSHSEHQARYPRIFLIHQVSSHATEYHSLLLVLLVYYILCLAAYLFAIGASTHALAPLPHSSPRHYEIGHTITQRLKGGEQSSVSFYQAL